MLFVSNSLQKRDLHAYLVQNGLADGAAYLSGVEQNTESKQDHRGRSWDTKSGGARAHCSSGETTIMNTSPAGSRTADQYRRSLAHGGYFQTR